MVKIQFSTDSDAFRDDDYERPDDWFFKASEIKRILEKVAQEIENGSSYGPIIDINGNKIGSFSVEE